MHIISHVPSRKRQIAAEMFTGHCSMVDPPRKEFASCHVWLLAFGGGLQVFGKLVDPWPGYFISSKQLNMSVTFTEVL
jgi:hypothetical protein